MRALVAFELILLAAASLDGACGDGACAVEHTEDLNLMQRGWPQPQRAHRKGDEINLAAKKRRRHFEDYEEPDTSVHQQFSEVEANEASTQPFLEFVDELSNEAEATASASAEEAKIAGEKVVAAVMARESAAELHNDTMTSHAALLGELAAAENKVVVAKKAAEDAAMEKARLSYEEGLNTDSLKELQQNEITVKQRNEEARAAATQAVKDAEKRVTEALSGKKSVDENIKLAEADFNKAEADFKKAEEIAKSADAAHATSSANVDDAKSQARAAIEEKGKRFGTVEHLEPVVVKADEEVKAQQQAAAQAQKDVEFQQKVVEKEGTAEARQKLADLSAAKYQADQKIESAQHEAQVAAKDRDMAKDELGVAETRQEKMAEKEAAAVAKVDELAKAKEEAHVAVIHAQKQKEQAEVALSKVNALIVGKDIEVKQANVAVAQAKDAIKKLGYSSDFDLKKAKETTQIAQANRRKNKVEENLFAAKKTEERSKETHAEALKALEDVSAKVAKSKAAVAEAEKNKEVASIDATAASKASARAQARAEADAERAASVKSKGSDMRKAAMEMARRPAQKKAAEQMVRKTAVADAQRHVEELEAKLAEAKQAAMKLNRRQDELGDEAERTEMPRERPYEYVAKDLEPATTAVLMQPKKGAHQPKPKKQQTATKKTKKTKK